MPSASLLGIIGLLCQCELESCTTVRKLARTNLKRSITWPSSSTLMYNPETFEPIEKFRLNLSVDIKPNQQPQGVKDYYSEEINKLFNWN